MNGNSAHVYKLDDGKFRLTFTSASKSGAQFLSEIGDFTRWEIEDWLKDHLHPATDVLSDHFKSGQRLSHQNRPTGLAVQD
jgi:hypothetical protein